MSNSEKETTISYSMESEFATVFTRIKRDINKLDKLCAEFPDKCKCTRHDIEYGCFYTIHMSAFGFKRPRVMSDKAKEDFVKRMKNVRG